MINYDININKQKSAFWSIWLPLTIILILTLLSSYGISRTITLDTIEICIWKDLAIVLLLVPLTISNIVLFLTLVFFISFLNKLNNNLLPFFKNAQIFIFNISEHVIQLLTLLSKPLFLFDSISQKIHQNSKTVKESKKRLEQGINLSKARRFP